MPGGGSVGQYGDMPPELYAKKMEQTNMIGQDDQLNDYFRNTLVDTSPDAPLFAQDMPLENKGQLRKDVLNIRHTGARSRFEPNHPDLFLGFTDRDSRGYHTAGPDLKQAVAHSKKRAVTKDLLSDHSSDLAVPTGEKSTMRSIRDLRATMNSAKKRLHIFDTARDGRANPWAGAKSIHVSNSDKYKSGSVMPTAHEIANKKVQPQTDTVSIGWRQKGDHRVKVAQYGANRTSTQPSDVRISQDGSTRSHNTNTNQYKIQNRISANIVKEVSKHKKLPSDTSFEESAQSKNKLNKVLADLSVTQNGSTRSHNTNTDQYAIQNRISAIIVREVSKHKKLSSNASFEESIQSKNKLNKLLADLSVAQNSTRQSADTVDLGYMGVNTHNIQKTTPMPHDSVVIDQSIFKAIKDNKNISLMKKTNPYSNRNTITNVFNPIPEEVIVYSRIQPKYNKQLSTELDNKWRSSTHGPNYKQGHKKHKNMNTSSTDFEQGVNPHSDAVFNSFKKGPGYTQAIRSKTDLS